MEKPTWVLLVEDEITFNRLLQQRLERHGFEVMAVATAEEALAALQKNDFDVAVFDQRLPGIDGLELLRRAKKMLPCLEVIMLTGYGSIENAIAAIKEGAYDYLTKPCQAAQLELALRQAAEKKRLATRAEGLSEALRRQTGAGVIIGQSPAMREVLALIAKVADSEAPVLVLGESGTGKELVARALHFNSSRRDQPFQALNSAAVPPQLVESELFGHTRGAFTGAVASKAGLVEVAAGGTLFLDEIADMDPAVQAKFLRFLETGEYHRVGDTRVHRVKVRVVAATNRHLAQEIPEGRFREDLYYRLNVITITLPPLRERREDIPLLARYFLQAKNNTRQEKKLSPAAMAALQEYDFPGNVRELANMIERGILLAPGSVIEPAHLFGPAAGHGTSSAPSLYEEVDLTLASLERQHIFRVLSLTGGNKTRAARLLGIGLRTLYRKIEEYGL